jgi:hypothetical protein
MDAEFTLPFFAQTKWVLAIFILSLLFFHWLLICHYHLSKAAWKKIDYIWLGIGALGLISAVEVPRNAVSENLLSLAEIRMGGALEMLNWTAKFGTSGAICRTFVRSEVSLPEPEFSNAQKEYDATCSWFSQVIPMLPTKLEELSEPIAMNKFPPIPSVSDQAPVWCFKQFRREILNVNQNFATIIQLQENMKRNFFEELLHMLGPMLLAIAIALRITKVTGELKK